MKCGRMIGNPLLVIEHPVISISEKADVDGSKDQHGKDDEWWGDTIRVRSFENADVYPNTVLVTKPNRKPQQVTNNDVQYQKHEEKLTKGTGWII
ncbi:hypothetical protein GWI33_018644 [Rhynchophorus ferrugineus]|uniref:Uncharacterized protein n=1 Tax=Rhynchophorus ferrugineus TaxID=354439 RepID=A0A834I6W9_RHYFE|nr:hypothetical protein GWI33_018644 [Rhynchophorus ferrugineus]